MDTAPAAAYQQALETLTKLASVQGTPAYAAAQQKLKEAAQQLAAARAAAAADAARKKQ